MDTPLTNDHLTRYLSQFVGYSYTYGGIYYIIAMDDNDPSRPVILRYKVDAADDDADAGLEPLQLGTISMGFFVANNAIDIDVYNFYLGIDKLINPSDGTPATPYTIRDLIYYYITDIGIDYETKQKYAYNFTDFLHANELYDVLLGPIDRAGTNAPEPFRHSIVAATQTPSDDDITLFHDFLNLGVVAYRNTRGANGAKTIDPILSHAGPNGPNGPDNPDGADIINGLGRLIPSVTSSSRQSQSNFYYIIQGREIIRLDDYELDTDQLDMQHIYSLIQLPTTQQSNEVFKINTIIRLYLEQTAFSAKTPDRYAAIVANLNQIATVNDREFNYYIHPNYRNILLHYGFTQFNNFNVGVNHNGPKLSRLKNFQDFQNSTKPYSTTNSIKATTRKKLKSSSSVKNLSATTRKTLKSSSSLRNLRFAATRRGGKSKKNTKRKIRNARRIRIKQKRRTQKRK